ncbi:MAG: cache domain-containing protein, partial [Asticcacaulis sp.]
MTLRARLVAMAMGLTVLATGTLTTLNQMALRSSLSAKYDQAAHAAALEARNSMSTIAQRLGVYTATLSDRPELIAMAQDPNPDARGRLGKAFEAFKAKDPTLSSLEVTDRDGTVVARGHKPAEFGDSKAGATGVTAALRGQIWQGYDYSRASGNMALDSVVPIYAEGRVVGTLKAGARLKDATAQAIRALVGDDVVLILNGKVVATAFAKPNTQFNPDSKRLGVLTLDQPT